MLFGFDESGEKLRPSPGARSSCIYCGGELIAKCGEINIWHWAHKSLTDCEGASETAWHMEWKACFKPENVEIPIEKDSVRKIADLVTDGGLIVEFQNSPISPDEIRLRESFYDNMIWVFNADDAYYNDRLETFINFGKSTKDVYYTFRWKHAKKTILSCKKPIYLDLGNGNMFRIKKTYKGPPVRGWGYMRSSDHFVNRVREM
jgi:competence protein CoiA